VSILAEYSVLTALWLGILTSVSPCPLATNVAAMSYIARQVGSVRAVILSGLLYTLGRMTVYAVIGALAVGGLLAISPVALFLQTWMNRLIGPILIVVGLVLVGVIPLPVPSGGIADRAHRFAGRFGTFGGAFVLGALFALAFCPVSAALFFGTLIPLALNERSWVLLPAVYGIGTGLPVVAFAVAVGTGINAVARLFNRVTAAEVWVRHATAGVFVLVGLYLTIRAVIR
jgi:cytochrome c biogenesis protein CcdA